MGLCDQCQSLRWLREALGILEALGVRVGALDGVLSDCRHLELWMVSVLESRSYVVQLERK